MRVGLSHADFEALIIDGPIGRTSMEPIVMTLLQVLCDNPDKVMSREDLITAVWGVEYGGDERLSRAISLLRKALGDTKNPRQYIETISRRGYRLIAPVANDVTPAALEPTPHIKSTERKTDNPVAGISVSGGQPRVAASPADLTAPLQTLAVTRPSVSRWMKVAALSIAAVATISVSVTALRPLLGVPNNVRLEDGLHYVENHHLDGSIDKAEAIFNAMLAKDSEHAAARAGLALALLRKYMYIESDPSILQLATAHAQAAVRLDEHLALANLSRSLAHELNGEEELAHELLDRVDILDPDNKMALLIRARLFSRQGKFETAETILKRSSKLYPNEDDFIRLLARNLERQGDFEGAETSFRDAIKISPDNAVIYAQLSHMLHMQNKTDEAINIIQDGLKINETPLLYSNLGAYLFFQGHYDLAVSAFEKTLELEGDTHDYLYWSNLADSYRWLPGRKDDAKVAYRRAIQLLDILLDKFPTSVDLNTRSALYHAKLGDWDGSQAALSKIDMDAELQAVQYYRLAVTYEVLSNRSQALRFLARSIEADYPMNESRMTLSWQSSDKISPIINYWRKIRKNP